MSPRDIVADVGKTALLCLLKSEVAPLFRRDMVPAVERSRWEKDGEGRIVESGSPKSGAGRTGETGGAKAGM